MAVPAPGQVAPPGQAQPASARRLPPLLRERLERTLWLDYSPTGFDPTRKPVRAPAADDIRRDLEAFRTSAGAAGHDLGIVLYGCTNGLEQLPILARASGLRTILGIWDPKDAVELRNAEALLRSKDLEEWIAAVCIGNETQTFRRCSLQDIALAAKRLRDVRAVPITTTEIIQEYGRPDLLALDMDLVFPNIHGLFAASARDPVQAARWTADQIRALKREYDGLILVKECGWPAGPEPAFDDNQQAAFWQTVLADPIARDVNFCIFECSFDAMWKHEWVAVEPARRPADPAFRLGNRADIGPFWSVFGRAPERQPRKAFAAILNWWGSRARAAR
jgi:exo-beta-1,3-glucanase (GH17 family)